MKSNNARPMSGVATSFSLAMALAPIALVAEPAFAQPATGTSNAGDAADIIVTARRRNETAIAVPVTLTAVSAEELSRRGIVSMQDLAKTVPTLVSPDLNNAQAGGPLVLRGVGGVFQNPIGDAAVAYSIDGVTVAKPTIKRLSNFDVANVQVLEGPQALYFGKNSPGGIIVINSADPTDKFEAGGFASYEVVGEEFRLEGFASGPLSDTVGVRLAGFADDLRGYVKNQAPANPLFGPNPRKFPKSEEFGARLTLTFKPSSKFNARLKLTYDDLANAGVGELVQIVNCGLKNAAGVPTAQANSADDCTANNTNVKASIGPNFAAKFGAPFRPDGRPDGSVRQYLGGLEMNYNLTDAVTLTSQTGYYRQTFSQTGQTNNTDATTATRMIGLVQKVFVREVGEELRLTSSFNGPLNFLLGGYYQESANNSLIIGGFNGTLASPITALAQQFKQDGKAYSVFGSLTFKPIEVIEISGGARYSHESKTLFLFNPITHALSNPALPNGIPDPKGKWHNLSPEVTIAFRPDADLNIYASYKQGFLSGGFNAIASNVNQSVKYDQEKVKGFEGGIKARLFDGALRTTFAAYSYQLEGLQVGSIITTVPNAPASVIINNAGAARTKGIEGTVDWRSPIPGLDLRGAFAYTDAYYVTYTGAACYTGQTVALGCNLGFASNRFNAQDLSGTSLPQAPHWVETLGGTYSIADAGENRYIFSVDASHTSRVIVASDNNPFVQQPGYWLLDAAFRFQTRSGLEFGVIGKNLTNKYYFEAVSNVSGTGGGTGTAVGIRGDTAGGVSRGRQVLFRLGYKFQ